MIAHVVPDGDRPYLLIRGICSQRTLGTFVRAVTSWYAFGRYDRVLVDLAGFDEWSPQMMDRLSAAVRTAAEAGRWLGFVPLRNTANLLSTSTAFTAIPTRVRPCSRCEGTRHSDRLEKAWGAVESVSRR
jgi:hypothetical protein